MPTSSSCEDQGGGRWPELSRCLRKCQLLAQTLSAGWWNVILCVFQLGAKKGSLGAQKLTSTCFTEMEKQAQAVDKLKEQEDLARTAPKEESM